jgi:alpha-tubulin suppressor-like RCC1 family protein
VALLTLGCENVPLPTAPSFAAPSVAPARIIIAAVPLAFIQVSAGLAHTCGVTTDHAVYCWGLNTHGQLGDETTSERLLPTRLSPTGPPHPRVLAFDSVEAGGEHTCGITSSHEAYCWGRNDRGQLGIGGRTDRYVPTLVKGGYGFVQVSAGAFHTCGVSTNTETYCWGLNDHGQLGRGTEQPASLPTLVLGAHKFTQVSAGFIHTCGVTPNAFGSATEAYCWGFTANGALGNDKTGYMTNVPALVLGGHQFDQVSAGVDYTCGTVGIEGGVGYCWGANGHGQLGDGTTSSRVRPRHVVGLKPRYPLNNVSAGIAHTCGVTINREAFCWGANEFGQLGDGTTNDHKRPVPVALGLYSFDQLSASGQHTCGVTVEFRGPDFRPMYVAYCWGRNDHGQLGDGTNETRLLPFPVALPASGTALRGPVAVQPPGPTPTADGPRTSRRRTGE